MTKQLENSIINGTGSGQPKGILTETPISTITISTSPSYENICAAEAAVPIEYDNSAVWCMTKSAIIAFQSITDNGGQPILRTAINSNGKFEHVILGRPVALCNYLPVLNSSTAENTVVAFIFNFKDYILNTNYEMRVTEYENYETENRIKKAVMLADGKSVSADSLVIIKTKTAETTNDNS
jgi:HK97 family phage major capsid protein